MSFSCWRPGLALLLTAFAACLLIPGLLAAPSGPTVPGGEVALAQEEGGPVVEVGMWVIDVYDFNYPSGSYVFDFYIYFYWTDANITTINWYVMNGLPSTPATKQLVSNGTDNGTSYEFYRVRADLSYPLEAGDYPFQKVVLPISVEVVNLGDPVELRWQEERSGVDPGFKIVGWRVSDVDYVLTPHEYPFESGTDQATLNIVIEREMIVAVPEMIIPPLIFCLISAFSFLLRMDDSSAFGLRMGLNTSMLITTVLFNLAEQDKMPPTSTVNFYTVFIIGVFIFLAINMVVTILGYVQYNYRHDVERLKVTNRLGILLSISVPVVLIIVILLSVT